MLLCLKIIMDNNQQKHIKLANNYYSKVLRKSLKAHFQLQQMGDELNKSYKWMPCTNCLARCNRFQREFKRAFETLSSIEQAQLFYNYSYSTYNITFNVPENRPRTARFKKTKLYVLNSGMWEWQLKQVQIDSEQMILSLVKEQISINLCNFIFRNSKNRLKSAIALESTSKFQYIQTLRLSNSQGTFQSFRTQMKSLMLLAMKKRISNQLETQIIEQQRTIEAGLSQKVSARKSFSINDNNPIRRISTRQQIKINDLNETEKTVENFNEVKRQFLLYNKDNCEKIQNNFLFDPIDKIFRRESQITINQKLLVDNYLQQYLLNQKLFQEWKPYLLNADFISQRSNIKIFREQHKISQKLFQFKYSRTKFYENNCFLYFDRPQQQQNAEPQTKYCITKIQYFNTTVKIAQQCRFCGLNDEKTMLQMANCLFGDLKRIKSRNKENKLQTFSSFNDLIQQSSQIQQISDQIHQSSFYSISQQKNHSLSQRSQGYQMKKDSILAKQGQNNGNVITGKKQSLKRQSSSRMIASQMYPSNILFKSFNTTIK